MGKYNLSAIMKRAWELVKRAGMTISEGLKRAWKEAKEMKEIVLKGTEKQVGWAKDIIKGGYEAIEKLEGEMRNRIADEPNISSGEMTKKYIEKYEKVIEACEVFKKSLDNTVEKFDDAAWFIKHRGNFSYFHLREKMVYKYFSMKSYGYPRF